MKLKTMNRRKKSNGALNRSGSGSIRPGVILVLALVAFAGVALIIKTTRSRTPEPTTDTITEPVQQTDAPQKPSRAITPSPRPAANSPPLTGSRAPASPPSAETDALPRTQETVQAANAITRLTQLGSPSAVTAEQAEEINTQLKQIITLGAPAAAAIRDFLQKDIDLAYGKQIAPIGAGTGAPSSLRLGLIDALGKIGGTEATTVAAEVLQRTLAPAEIGLLAKTLEQQAPGEYRDAALAASREALAAAAKNPSSEQEVAGLFQIIQTYGDSSVIPDLQNLSGQWRYYGLMAIAGLPEAQGVPALVEMATRPGAQASGYQQLATQMLAQLAPTSPDAQSALLEQVKAGQISNWTEVAMALTGARLQFGQDLFADEKNLDPGKVTQTHHVVYGNQNFRTVTSEIPEAQLEQNRALIDQLMGLTTDTAAREALQRAKEKLSPANSN
jgi:hypothetical protein